jgi:putative flippase GtrA
MDTEFAPGRSAATPDPSPPAASVTDPLDPATVEMPRAAAADGGLLRAADAMLDRLLRGRRLPSFAREVSSFAVVGVVSTIAYVVLYAALRGTMSAAAANALALLITAVGNTAANRRFTFAVRGRQGLARDHVGGLVAFAVALVITSASISMLQVVSPRAGRLVELAVLVTANVVATLARFLLLRLWIQRSRETAAVRVTAVTPRR